MQLRKEMISSDSYVDSLHSLTVYCESLDRGQLGKRAQVMHMVISKKFPEFAADFQRKFGHKAEEDADLCALQKIMFLAAYLETADKHQLGQYLAFARTLHQLFGGARDAMTFLHRHVQPAAKLPIHDACIFQLPKDGEKWDVDYWRSMALKYGKPVTRILPLATKIDSIRSQQLKGKNQNELIGKGELQRLRIYAAAITYANAEQHPELAALCMKFHKSEEVFEKCLALIKSGIKETCYLPDFEIHGKSIDAKYANFRMMKLPLGDLRGMFLGEYSNCCQSIGGLGSRIAEAGMVSPYAGFYVICNEKDEIVAQLFAWISKDNKVIFDSWEPKVSEYNYLFAPFITRTVPPIMAAGFNGVRVGLGGRTPINTNFVVAETSSQPIKNNHKYDANRQLIVCDKMISQQDKIKKFKLFAARANMPAEKYLHLATSDYPAVDIINELEMITVDELMLLYQFFYESELIRQDRDHDFTDEINAEFMSKLFSVYSAGEHTEVILGLFQRLISKGYIKKMNLDEIADFVTVCLGSKDPMEALVMDNPSLLFITTSANLSLIDQSSDYVKSFTKIAVFALMELNGGMPERTVEEQNRDNAYTLEIMNQIVTDHDAPMSMRSLFLCLMLDRDRSEEGMISRVKPNLDIIKIRHLINFGDLSRILKGAIEAGDIELLASIKTKMLEEAITPADLSTSSSFFRISIPNSISFDASLVVIALLSECQDSAEFFIKNFTDQDGLRAACMSSINLLEKDKWRTVIGKDVYENKASHLIFVRSLLSDDSLWHKIILCRQGHYLNNNHSALHRACDLLKFEPALAIIRGYQNIINLHSLLTTCDSEGKRPLDYLAGDALQQHSHDVRVMVAAICKAYVNSPDLLKELSDQVEDEVLKGLLLSSRLHSSQSIFGVIQEQSFDTSVDELSTQDIKPVI